LNDSPTQQAMDRAIGRMRQAQEKLEQADRAGALEDQEEAIAALQRARSQLERILRQYREEEIIQRLQALETRLRRMLQMQHAIRSRIESLDDQLTAAEDDESLLRPKLMQVARLGQDQAHVTREADIAILLLREDGTAASFEEMLQQARFDMSDVESRLEKVDLGLQTRLIVDSVINTLQELISAVERAKQESENRQRDAQTGQTDAGSPNQALISLIAELRLIRSMQQRVNDRTILYEMQRRQPNADLPDLERRVEELTRQQTRIQRILHELSIGRHQ